MKALTIATLSGVALIAACAPAPAPVASAAAGRPMTDNDLIQLALSAGPAQSPGTRR